MAGTLKVTAKGQVTLRRGLLHHLGVTPGDDIAVDMLPSGRVEIRAAPRAASIEAFIGSGRRDGLPGLPLDEIEALAAAGWAGER